jgi:hypothetical protein
MSDSAHDLLVRGIAAAKAKDKSEARFYLEWVLRDEPDADQRMDAWLWLSEISEDPAEKRDYLERVLAENMAHPVARRKLALLDGRLNPAEVVDPDRLAQPAPGAPQAAEAQRFICPTCGGRMTFTPDGQSLTCEYCDRREGLTRPGAAADGVEDQDFIVALATARGHLAPVAVRSLACRSCGAVFMLSPETLSVTCPFCASAYVVETAETRELIPPAAVIPFAVARETAGSAARHWLESEADVRLPRGQPPVHGLYVPAWTFDLSFDLRWTYVKEDGQFARTLSGNSPAFFDDVVTAACEDLPEPLLKELDHYRLDGLKPYDARYLADWPARVYTVPLAEASLDARARTLPKARAHVTVELQLEGSQVQVTPAAINVTAFKLILLPAWLARYAVEGKTHSVVVNGQTGAVRAERPQSGVRKVLDWLLGDEQD